MPEHSAHLLIIDDNEDILFMLQTMLQMKGYKVSVKNNMEQLYEYIERVHPDLILMDMLLSGADGREVCKYLKSDGLLASIPVIMISAHPNAEKECLEAGANYFLGKPFEMIDLSATVAAAIEGASKR
ncbi:MAG: response regulator [Bacteroidota bacterium]